MATIYALIWKFSAVLGIVVFFVFVAIYIPLTRLTKPLAMLSAAAKKIGEGDFTHRAASNGVGEIALLNSSFNRMVDRLEERDKEIAKLHHEQVEMARLEAELKVARGIQSNLLPDAGVPASCGVDIAAKYIPATECAGDWYSHHYNESADEVIVAIADVSGHGAGASIFTALIAGVFDQFAIEEAGSWNLDKLMNQLNGVILRMGKGQWHATFIVAKINKSRRFIEFAGAGHPAPYICTTSIEGDETISKCHLPSDVLGLNVTPSFANKIVPIPHDTTIVLYTDCLLECPIPSGQTMGTRRVREMMAGVSAMTPSKGLSKIEKIWNSHKGNVPAVDDLCVLVVRVPS